MGKRANKEGSELEFLRGENRQLKKHIKNLQKELGRSNKELNKILNNLPEIEEQPVREVVKDNECPKCKAKLVEINLGARKLVSCKDCAYRLVIRNISK